MSDYSINQELLQREYELLQNSIQSILDLSEFASRTGGMNLVPAITAIRTISQHSIHCSPTLDDLFFPDADTEIDG